ncbi:MAG: DUF2299 family protein [Candidatus Thorarchaeota archaeon]
MANRTTEQIKDLVKNWFQDEGIKVESISNPRAEFLFKVKFQRFFFTVVRPNEKPFIQVESQVMISPQHLQALTADKMREFQMKTLQFSFQQGITLGFIQPRPGQPMPQGQKPPGPGFVISERLYDDAISDNQVWLLMKRVHGAVDMVIAILNEIVGAPAGPPPVDDAGPSYYT